MRLWMDDWMVAFPKSKRFVELKLVLKTNSVVGETGFKEKIIEMVVMKKKGSFVRNIMKMKKQRDGK